MASVSRLEVPSSMPLATLTSTVPGVTMSFSFRAVVRMAKEGVASTTMSQPAAADMSQVSFKFWGSGTPLSMGFSPF